MNLLDFVVGIFTHGISRHVNGRRAKIETAAKADADFVADTYLGAFEKRLGERFAGSRKKLIGVETPVRKSK